MTKIKLGVFLIWISLLIGGFSKPVRAETAQAVPSKQPALPLLFIENHGQYADSVQFQTIGGPFTLGFSDTAIWIYLPGRPVQPNKTNSQVLNLQQAAIDRAESPPAAKLKLGFAGANPDVHLVPFDILPANISYYRGQSAESWVAGAHSWRGVRYAGLYPGMDLEITGTADGWQFRWLIQERPVDGLPRLVMSGGEFAVVNPHPINEDVLLVETPKGVYGLPIPATNHAWELQGLTADSGLSILHLPRLNSGAKGLVSGYLSRPSQAVALSYGTYLGGSLWDEANDIAVDGAGNLYLAGHTLSPNFSTAFGRPDQLHNVDAFIARIGAVSGALEYLALFQGADLQNGEEWAMSIAVDAVGNAYATGRTNSPTFPVTPGAFDTTLNGDWDVFALKLDPAGGLEYATYLGGEQLDWGTDLALDNAGTVYITGGTFSTDFPTSPGAYDSSSNGSRDIFLTRLTEDGSALSYSTFIGGTGQDQGESLALATLDTVYITGWTSSTDFPATPGALSENNSGGFDAFIVKLSLTNPNLLFATYLGGAGEDRALGIAVQPQDNETLIGGRTNSDDFPITPDAFATVLGGGTCDFDACPDAFFVRLHSSGSSQVYATYLGGTGWDEARDLAVAGGGEILLSGETQSVDFPTTEDGFDQDLGGDLDGFFVAFAPHTYSLIQSSYLGGEGWDVINGVAVDTNGQIYLTGKTLSTDFPSSPDAHAPTLSGDYDAFAVRLSLTQSAWIYLPILVR
jgi:hypothetical protein